MEDVEGTSDVYIKAWINEKDKKETDTHWRCQNGAASFNYRILYDFKSPSYEKSDREQYKLTLQVYDRDIFKSNDYICEFKLDLFPLVMDVRLTQKTMHLSRKYYESYFKSTIDQTKIDIEFFDDDSFWLSIKRAEDSKPIRLRLDIRVLPGAEAMNQRVGSARSDPNHSPKLDPPIGRM